MSDTLTVQKGAVMVLWIIGGVIAYLLVCLFIASVCGSRRRYPAAPETHENRPQP